MEKKSTSWARWSATTAAEGKVYETMSGLPLKEIYEAETGFDLPDEASPGSQTADLAAAGRYHRLAAEEDFRSGRKGLR